MGVVVPMKYSAAYYSLHCFSCDSWGIAAKIPNLYFRFCECGDLCTLSLNDDAEKAYKLKRKHEKKDLRRRGWY